MARGAHSSNRSGGPAAGTSRARSGRGSGRARRASRLRVARIGRDPGDRLIAAGVVLFLLGLIAIAITFLPFITLQRSNTDLAVNLGTFATVLGLALGAIGGYLQARSLTR